MQANPVKRAATFVSNQIGIIVLVFGFVLMLMTICGYLFGWEWTGLSGTKDHGPRKLWDWLDLLIIPVVLAGGALWFRKTEADMVREIERQRANEAALEAYLDRMSLLLLENGLRGSEPGSPVQDLARARTLSLLRRLDRERQKQVLGFLSDAQLLGRVGPLDDDFDENYNGERQVRVALFAKADMNGMDFRGLSFSCMNMHRVNLSKANLQGANLSWANLKSARLRYADLRDADLTAATLSGAYLLRADLRGADMRDVKLENTHLGSVDLRGVKNLTCAQLSKAIKWESAYREEALACGLPIPKTPE
jgi:hypothetical protein